MADMHGVPHGGTSMDSSSNVVKNLDSDVLNSIVRIQATLDRHRASINLQNEILGELFAGLGSSKGTSHLKKKESECMASLLRQQPCNWDGKVEGRQVPSNFSQLLNLYKHKGMVNPQNWKLCLGDDESSHEPELFAPNLEDGEDDDLKCTCVSITKPRTLKRDCNTCCQRCTKCGKKEKDMINFQYISIIEQLKLLCKSQIICHDFLEMWRERDRWLEIEASSYPNYIKESWDGEKTRVCQQFWNPNGSWEAPIICGNPKCGMSYRAFPSTLRCRELQVGWKENLKKYSFTCTKCRHEIKQEKQMIKGDPRNFALMLHWDGFQAASTTIKDSAVVEIVVMNGGKRSILGSIPVLFLPLSHKDLEKKHGDVLSSFLHPLVKELERTFIDGFEVDYAYAAEEIDASLDNGKARLRTMLMLCTGDHPAQCKLGRVKDGGSSFCRRDKAIATQLEDSHGRRYVYSQNRKQARYPAKKRKVEEMWESIRHAKREAIKEKKEEILREAGLSGESILWRLYHLYGFDVSKDLVYDVMHILSLNLFQKYIRKIMSDASTSTKRDIDKVVKYIKKAMPNSISNTGRWPTNPSKHYKMFKAEECQKFIQWCLPCILKIRCGINERDVLLGLLLIDIAHMFFDCTRKNGWTIKDIQDCRSLLMSWRILSEEFDGPNSSPLEHVAGNGEILDDILRHGSHDCYWCFPFERSVSGYLGITTNNKSNEVSYTRFHTRLLFTKIWQQLDMEKYIIHPYNKYMEIVHSSLVMPGGYEQSLRTSITCDDLHKIGIMHVSSYKAAQEVCDAGSRLPICKCKDLLRTKGVLIGGKQGKPFKLNGSELKCLMEFYNISRQSALALDDVNCNAFCYSKVLLDDIRYSVGDYVVLKGSQKRGCLLKIFSHEQGGEIQVFVQIEYMKCSLENVDCVTGMLLVDKSERNDVALLIAPIACLSHLFFWMRTLDPNLEIAYETSSRKIRSRLLPPGQPGCVPPWVETGDTVLALKGDSELEVAIVARVNVENQKVLISWSTSSSELVWIELSQIVSFASITH